MTHAKRSVFGFALSLSVLLGITWPASAINYDDSCDSTSADSRWFGECPQPDPIHTNWEGDVLPGTTDHVVIDAQYGPIVVDGNENQATVLSVHAYGGLDLPASIYGLRLTSGESEINNLYLASNAEIHANEGVVVNLTGSSTLGAHGLWAGLLHQFGDCQSQLLQVVAGCHSEQSIHREPQRCVGRHAA